MAFATVLDRHRGDVRAPCAHQYDEGMTQRKRRLTVTVDPELVEVGNRAVASGAADSLSAWVSIALADKARRDEQLARLQDGITDYEAEFGEITAEDRALIAYVLSSIIKSKENLNYLFIFVLSLIAVGVDIFLALQGH